MENIQEFATEAEALAFIQGVEIVSTDLTVEGPYTNSNNNYEVVVYGV